MEDDLSRLFDLIESKPFGELNNEERDFVLKQITEEEYSLQRKIHASARELAFEEAIPAPLVIPAAKKQILTRTIPLYQVLIGVACLLVGFFVFSNRKGNSIDIQFLENPVQVSLINAPGEVKIIHDTIREKLGLRSPVQVVRDTVTQVQTVFVTRNETRLLEAGNTLNSIPLDKNLLETGALSAKDDGSVKLLPNLNDYGAMK
jgi:hypothetical protein